MVSRRAPADLYAAIEALPEHQTGEIIAGSLHVQPRPAQPRSEPSQHRARRRFLSRHRRARWLDHPLRARTSPRRRRPRARPRRLASRAHARRRRRRPLHPRPRLGLRGELARHRRTDLVLKLPIYAREGISHVWLVDPLDPLLEVFRRDGAQWTLVAAVTGTTPVALEPFDAVPLDLAFLFGS